MGVGEGAGSKGGPLARDYLQCNGRTHNYQVQTTNIAQNAVQLSAPSELFIKLNFNTEPLGRIIIFKDF